jgi:hypothetical protein
MANAVFKLVEKRELSLADAHAVLSGQAQSVLRIDVNKGATTIYFAADKTSATSKELRGRAEEVKLDEVTKL